MDDIRVPLDLEEPGPTEAGATQAEHRLVSVRVQLFDFSKLPSSTCTQNTFHHSDSVDIITFLRVWIAGTVDDVAFYTSR